MSKRGSRGFGAGEMVQSAKYWPHTHKIPTSDPPKRAIMACTSNAGDVVTGEPLGYTSDSLAKLLSSRFKKPCLKK